jgi:hypothetical protein
MKRVASAVGEGATAVQLVHEYLASTEAVAERALAHPEPSGAALR